MALLDTEGLDGLTMRKLGAALNVQAGALYRHYPSKEALLDAMAERLLEGVADPLPEGPWDQQLTVLAQRFVPFFSPIAYGARVVAGTFVNEPNTDAAGSAAVDALRRRYLRPQGRVDHLRRHVLRTRPHHRRTVPTRTRPARR